MEDFHNSSATKSTKGTKRCSRFVPFVLFVAKQCCTTDFYLKPFARSNRIRDMYAKRDSWMFALTVSTAAAVLVSIAAAETLLAIACIVWLAQRQHPIVW